MGHGSSFSALDLVCLPFPMESLFRALQISYEHQALEVAADAARGAPKTQSHDHGRGPRMPCDGPQEPR